MKLAFFSDPGHGWLKVPLRIIGELGIAYRISKFSHIRGRFAYLEEDCDAPLFLKAAKERGVNIEFEERVSNRLSRIRSYMPYG